MPEGTSVNVGSTPSSEVEDTDTTVPKADVVPESSEELATPQENPSSQGGENSSEIKEDTANSATSEVAAKGETDEHNGQPKATENIDDWMPDKNLQSAIASALKMNVSQITKSDMLKLTALNFDNAGITNLTGLEYANNVRTIDLQSNKISDLTPLQNLTSLDTLYLFNNKVSDLTPLQNLTQLTFLNIRENQISDLSPLQNLSQLGILWSGDNPFSDITPLKNLAKLHTFDFENTNVEDISILSGKAGSAYFKGAKIADLSPANGCTIWSAENQRVTLPPIYVPNKQPYSVSVEAPIKGSGTGIQTLVPQSNGSWTGVYSGDSNSGKVEWSGGNQVPETGDLVSTWSTTQKNLGGHNYTFSGTYTQPYILSKATVDAHNSTLYTGDSWSAQDNFDSATDKLGNPVAFNGVQVTGTVDTTQPGKYKITYTCDDAQKEIEVTVLQNQTSVEAHDSTLYTGDTWNAQDNFDGAKDRDGNPVNFQDVQVTGTVDTTQPGKYKVTYSYGGVQKEIEVTVLQNQTSVDAHNSTLYTGDNWNAQDNFDGAKDKAGNPVNFQDVQVTGSVDTTQPGKYKVTYSYGGVQKEIEVTVLQKVSKEDNFKEDKKNENPKTLSTNEKEKALPSTGEKSSVWLLVSGVRSNVVYLCFSSCFIAFKEE